MPSQTASRFAVFAWLFALASVLYHSNVAHFRLGPAQHALSIALACVILVRPTALAPFLAFVLAQTLEIAAALPSVNTNRLLQLFVGATILCSTPFARPISGSAGAERLLRACGPPLRCLVVIVYFFSFWHKLNPDFLDPDLSCGAALYGNFVREFARTGVALPVSRPAVYAAIYGTLLVEGGLAFALILSRTRVVALCLGWLFHYLLGLAGFYDFAATMMALLFLFVPDACIDALAKSRIFAMATTRGPGRPLTVALGASGVLMLGRSLDSQVVQSCVWGFWCLTIAPIALACVVLWKTRSLESPAEPCFTPISRLLWGMPILMTVNCLQPYLGLKTEGAFAMYSNLRTEGGVCNHLLIRRPLALANYQTDLATVVESTDEVLAPLVRSGDRLPFVVLQIRAYNAMRAGKPYTLRYRRNGNEGGIPGAGDDPVTVAPTFIERRWLRFRPIPVGRNKCAH
ncbi:MAG: hypothetical protein ACT4QC_14100 [Planctomycetaceae bacterium]